MDRVKGYTVTLHADMSEEDADAVQSAIELIKGVLSVTPSVANHEDHINRERIRREMRNAVLGIISREN